MLTPLCDMSLEGFLSHSIVTHTILGLKKDFSATSNFAKANLLALDKELPGKFNNFI
jgi:hypothetical protein